MDVTGAFDTVWHEGLLFKLKWAGIPHYLLKTIKSFLAERTFQVRIGPTTSQKKRISAGVPQGAILIPTLYNVYCHDLQTPTDAYIATYANDTIQRLKHSHNSLTDLY